MTWELRDDVAARPISLEALIVLVERLRADGKVDAARALYDQLAGLAQIAESWRHRQNAPGSSGDGAAGRGGSKR